jgi:hypothetical protein
LGELKHIQKRNWSAAMLITYLTLTLIAREHREANHRKPRHRVLQVTFRQREICPAGRSVGYNRETDDPKLSSRAGFDRA